jgi:hypothetical protein
MLLVGMEMNIRDLDYLFIFFCLNILITKRVLNLQ